MDYKHLSTDYSLKTLLNIIGEKGAISNINYHYSIIIFINGLKRNVPVQT